MTRTLTARRVDADEAADLILQGDAPTGLAVEGALSFHDERRLRRLPEGLTVRRLSLVNCPNLEGLPAGLRVRHLELRDCPQVSTLPEGLRCYELSAPGSALTELPDDLRVEFRLDLSGSTALTALPEGLTVGTLDLRNCTALTRLPEGLDVCFLDLSGCTRLANWPERLSVKLGRLNVSGCVRLTGLPPGVRQLGQLDLSGCPGITSLPEGLRVSSWLDVAGTGLKGLPASLDGVRLRWRGVAVNERIAFRP
jgi:hypothetical protein